MRDKTVNIDNFIGVYDNYILPEECDKAIKLFKDQDNFNNTMNSHTTNFTKSFCNWCINFCF